MWCIHSKGEPLENEYVVELDSSGIYNVTAYDYAGNRGRLRSPSQTLTK